MTGILLDQILLGRQFAQHDLLLLMIPFDPIEAQCQDIFVDDWLIDREEFTLELVVLVVAVSDPLQHLVKAVIHFLSVELGVVLIEAIVHDRVARVQGLSSDIRLKSYDVETINFFLGLSKICFDLINNSCDLLSLLQVLDG